jgi:hypothetical protein
VLATAIITPTAAAAAACSNRLLIAAGIAKLEYFNEDYEVYSNVGLDNL